MKYPTSSSKTSRTSDLGKIEYGTRQYVVGTVKMWCKENLGVEDAIQRMLILHDYEVRYSLNFRPDENPMVMTSGTKDSQVRQQTFGALSYLI